MKTFVLLVLVLAALLGGYFYTNPEQAPSWLPGVSGKTPPEVTIVYKWRDQRGDWQITDQPPAEGISYETLDYHRNQNVLPLPPELQPKD